MKAENNLTGEIYTLRLTTDHAVSSYGQPVIVTEAGEAIDKFSWGFYELVEITDKEMNDLKKAGYQ